MFSYTTEFISYLFSLNHCCHELNKSCQDFRPFRQFKVPKLIIFVNQVKQSGELFSGGHSGALGGKG